MRRKCWVVYCKGNYDNRLPKNVEERKICFTTIAEIIERNAPNTVKRVKSLAKDTTRGLSYTSRSSANLAKHLILKNASVCYIGVIYL